MEWFSKFCTTVFGPPLAAFFEPYNRIMDQIPPIWWRLSAVGLFVGTMIWVMSLKTEYVNVDAPSKKWYHDLRIWTVLSMFPHVCIYLYF